MGLGSVVGLSKLTNLQELTLTLSESLEASGWRQIASLPKLTALNINALNDAVRDLCGKGRGVQGMQGARDSGVGGRGVETRDRGRGR
jgi:hypothetical protein